MRSTNYRAAKTPRSDYNTQGVFASSGGLNVQTEKRDLKGCYGRVTGHGSAACEGKRGEPIHAYRFYRFAGDQSSFELVVPDALSRAGLSGQLSEKKGPAPKLTRENSRLPRQSRYPGMAGSTHG